MHNAAEYGSKLDPDLRQTTLHLPEDDDPVGLFQLKNADPVGDRQQDDEQGVAEQQKNISTGIQCADLGPILSRMNLLDQDPN